MAVVVGVIGTMVTNVFLDPNNLFMFILVGMYAFTGILHPQELMCLLHGILYYLCVPSAFIFLMVYSLTNMNNVSWGTREVKKPTGSGESASEAALEEVANKNGKKKNVQIGPGSIYDAPTSADGYYSCGLGNLCQCALCIQPQNVHVPTQTQVVRRQPSRRFTHAGQRRYTTTAQHRQSMYKRFSMAKARQVTGSENVEVGSEIEHRLEQRMSVAQLRRISTRLGPDSMTTAQLRRLSSHQRRLSKRSNEPMDPNAPLQPMSENAQLLSQELAQEQEMQFENASYDGSFYDDAVGEERLQDEEEELLYWVMDGPLQDGVIEYLDDEEREFWKYLIQHYLFPLDEDKDEKARIKSNLKQLRNQVTGAYFLLNALWLILNFALQLTITDIAIVFFVNGTRISVNPVSFAFLLFFLIILVIQFTCMLIHRWSTALHLLSVTSLKWRDRRDGIKNVKNKDLVKAEMQQKFKKKKKIPNGHAFNVDDPLDREATAGTNFSFRERNSSSGYDNDGFAATEEDNSVNESDSVETLYEKIDTSKRFDNNPANRMFGSVSKNYINADGPAVRKTSANIDLTIFNETKKSSKKDKETAKREAKKSVFSDPAVDDLIEKQIQAQVHHQDPAAPKTKSHPGVRFGPLPTETGEVDEMNTAC